MNVFRGTCQKRPTKRDPPKETHPIPHPRIPSPLSLSFSFSEEQAEQLEEISDFCKKTVDILNEEFSKGVDLSKDIEDPLQIANVLAELRFELARVIKINIGVLHAVSPEGQNEVCELRSDAYVRVGERVCR